MIKIISSLIYKALFITGNSQKLKSYYLKTIEDTASGKLIYAIERRMVKLQLLQNMPMYIETHFIIFRW